MNSSVKINKERGTLYVQEVLSYIGQFFGHTVSQFGFPTPDAKAYFLFIYSQPPLQKKNFSAKSTYERKF